MNIRKNIFKTEDFKECLQRIEKLSTKSQPQWGIMNSAQMLSHCSEVLEVTSGKKELKNIPFYLFWFKKQIKKSVYGDKPYRRSLRTMKQYVPGDSLQFEKEKTRLFNNLEFIREKSEDLPAHPLFGKNSADDNGWAMYKHLDHHLTQFGV
jgi:hypothetical protein